MVYYGALQVTTAKDATFHSSPSLAAIKKQMIAFNPETGEIKTKAFITAILTDLVMYFNVGKTMNAGQVVQVVELIQRDYYFLKPSELKYCFDNAKIGRYGALYDRIDGSVIFGWIEKYLEERMDVCVQQNVDQNKTYNSEVMHHTVAEKLKTVLKDKEEDKTPKDKYVRRDPKNETEVRIQGYFKEFDQAFIDNPKGSITGRRFVEYKGMIVNVEEYIDLRLMDENPNR